MRSWPARILRHLLVLLSVTVAGSLFTATPIFTIAFLANGIDIAGMKAFGAFIILQHIMIAPGMVFYFPLSILLWRKSKSVGVWMLAGASCLFCSAVAFVAVVLHHPWPTVLFLFDLQMQTIAAIFVAVGWVLGATHFWTLESVSKRYPRFLKP